MTAHPVQIQIDLSQFRKNLALIRQHIGKSLFCLPIKANAYGHGLIGIGKAAAAAGVDCLGVSCLQEGVKLRQAGICIPILVLGAFHEEQIEDLLYYQLELTVSSKFKADLLAKRLKGTCRIHLEVETGMQRTGVRPETAQDLIRYIQNLPGIEVVGVYSHLANSELPHDPITQRQIGEFQKLISLPSFQGITAHMANSGAVAHYPEAYFHMVRPGLMAFGYLPPHAPGSLQGIAPCFSLKSKVSYFKVVGPGQGISYGHTYVTRKQTRVVTVPIGYGDGYRRALSNRGSVLIRGKRYTISGAVCMDQFMVDVGDDEIYVGDEVVLIGKQGKEEIKLAEVAFACDTVPYEVLCLFNERIPRVYTEYAQMT